MAKIQKGVTSFATGEISPKMLARVDFAKYRNSLEKLENFILLPQGAIQSRSGSRFVVETKDSSAQPRVIPFIFSTTDAYILEVGNLYIRFYKDGAQITSGHSRENAKIRNRKDKDGNKIPDGMPLWRYRMGQRRKRLNNG